MHFCFIVIFCIGLPYYCLYLFLFTKLWCSVDVGDYYFVGDGHVSFQGQFILFSVVGPILVTAVRF
jgi:hypothetical protein